MIRHLIEMLIVGAFEHHSLGDKIKKDGDYLQCSPLSGEPERGRYSGQPRAEQDAAEEISDCEGEQTWRVTRMRLRCPQRV